MLRAKLIAGVPGDLIGSLTGLTEGRFPVAAHARYADDPVEKMLNARKVRAGRNAANVITGSASRQAIDIFANKGAPVVAVNDGVIKKIGSDPKRGRYLVLQDVYGNQYTYNGLGEVMKAYPVPKVDATLTGNHALPANSAAAPKGSATAGRQAGGAQSNAASSAPKTSATVPSSHAVVKPVVFAHPWRAAARTAGSTDQLFTEATTTPGYSNYDAIFAHVLGLNAKNAVLKPLRPAPTVVPATLIGPVANPDPPKAAHGNSQIR